MPHPCFDMKALSRLPLRLQKFAENILVDSAKSTENLFIISHELAVQDQAFFLPAFYRILVPPPFASKPKDSLSMEEDEQLGRFAFRIIPVLRSLEILRANSLFPRPALVDIWDRIWTCILIQGRYIDEFAALGGAPAKRMLRVQVFLVVRFAIWDDLHLALFPPPVLEEIVTNTPHIREYLTEILARMIHDADLRMECATGMRYLLAYFMRNAEGPNFDQLVIGAGGTVSDLCTLGIKYLHVVVADIESNADPEWILHSVIFIQETFVNNERHCLECVATEGLVKSIMRVSMALHTMQAKLSWSEATVLSQLSILLVTTLAFQQPYPRTCIMDGLRAGLLTSMALCVNAEMREDHELIKPYTQLLDAILPGFLTSYSVLSRLENALVRLDEAGLSARLANSPLRRPWSTFRDLANQRIAVKTQYDDVARRSVRMCDSIKCNVVQNKTDFHRCAQCMSMYYCSPACQKVDWFSGRHGELCWGLAKKGGTDASTREKSFLRFLLHTDYIAHKHTILSLRAEYMATSDPAREPFYTEFNYTAGPVQISILSAEPLIARLPAGTQRVEAAYQLGRSIIDRCKTSLDVAVLPLGAGESRYWILPMRSTSATVYEGLVRVVGDKAAGRVSDQVYEDLLKGLAEERDLVEVH
ncbi:hypothetical protein DFH06DRAFT_1483306 [Mycena polygramma]|nr:hypothetical protein DFH06DRAFT_1483306 [Mycena polygramma]